MDVIGLINPLLENFSKAMIIISVGFLFVAGAGRIPKTLTVIPDDIGRIFLGIG
jgi:hypothetical protein